MLTEPFSDLQAQIKLAGEPVAAGKGLVDQMLPVQPKYPDVAMDDAKKGVFSED